MPKVDLDFQRYVERRKGAREAQAREGAAYAYGGDLRVLRTLDRLRPVRMALDGAVRLWRSSAREELLAGAVKASPKEHAKVLLAAEKCAAALHVSVPTVYVVKQRDDFEAHTFGTDEDAYIVVTEPLVARASEPELLATIGRELGHLQNGHATYVTAYYYLTHDANRFIKWIVSPAVLALSGWDKRATITCDRAGLLCARNLDAVQAVMGAPDDPMVLKRGEALQAFSESAYYRGIVGEQGGLSPSECDAKVSEIMS
jgi:hypothetical protein